MDEEREVQVAKMTSRKWTCLRTILLCFCAINLISTVDCQHDDDKAGDTGVEEAKDYLGVVSDSVNIAVCVCVYLIHVYAGNVILCICSNALLKTSCA